LKDALAFDSAELADRAIHRTHQIGRRQRPPAAGERARENSLKVA